MLAGLVRLVGVADVSECEDNQARRESRKPTSGGIVSGVVELHDIECFLPPSYSGQEVAAFGKDARSVGENKGCFWSSDDFAASNSHSHNYSIPGRPAREAERPSAVTTAGHSAKIRRTISLFIDNSIRSFRAPFAEGG